MKDAVVERVEARAYLIPTEEPESDGTYRWQDTVMVAVHLYAGGERGFGYSYAHPSAALLVRDKLADAVRGKSAFNLPALREAAATDYVVADGFSCRTQILQGSDRKPMHLAELLLLALRLQKERR